MAKKRLLSFKLLPVRQITTDVIANEDRDPPRPIALEVLVFLNAKDQKYDHTDFLESLKVVLESKINSPVSVSIAMLPGDYLVILDKLSGVTTTMADDLMQSAAAAVMIFYDIENVEKGVVVRFGHLSKKY